MTCVVGLAVDGAVFMAADSVNNVYGRPIPAGAVKIRRLTNPMTREHLLIGVCGEGAMAHLISGKLDPWEVSLYPKPNDSHDPDRLQAWADDLAMKVTDIAKEFDCFENGRIAGSYLLGWRGLLWTLTHNQAMPHSDGLAAIGSGEELAMGAMAAFLQVATEPVYSAMVVGAVAIACRYDRYCEPPIQVEVLEAAS